MPEDKNLFRKKALSAIAEESETEHVARVTSRFTWLALLALLIALTALTAWLFLGSIPVRVHGEGILLPERGSLFRAVAPEGSGRIQAVRVSVGDRVEKDQIVADLRAQELKKQLDAEQNLLEKLETEDQQLKAQYQRELAARIDETARQEKTLNNILESETKNLKQIQDLLETKQRSLAKGIATRQEVAIRSREFYIAKREIENTLKELSALKTAMQDFRQQWDDRLRSLELRLRESQRSVEHLQDRYRLSQAVRSPVSGIVTHVQVSTGQKVTGGAPVVLVSSGFDRLDALVYIPAREGKNVKAKMEVQISPSIYKKQEYGSIRGSVVHISTYPMTADAIQSVLQNEKLTERFLLAGPLLAVRVKLLPDPNSISGYAWTTSHGPAQKITPGTLVDAMIQVETKKPIQLLLPQLKKLVSES